MATVPEWLKILTLITVLTGWLATVVVTLWRGELPDAATLGIPAAVVIALAPPVTIGRRRGTGTRARRAAVAPADEAAPTEEADEA